MQYHHMAKSAMTALQVYKSSVNANIVVGNWLAEFISFRTMQKESQWLNYSCSAVYRQYMYMTNGYIHIVC